MNYVVRVFLAGFLVSASAASGGAPPALPGPPAIAAGAHILQDFHSGLVLAEENADQPMEPASLAKLMTSYVVFAELAEGNMRLTDPVFISEKAWRTGGSRTFVEVDTEVPVEVLLKGMIIQSGNDASVALAEHMAGDEAAFAQLMNQYAGQLGMGGTHFTNATGLPDADMYTTARDMATLAAAIIRDFPEYYPWHHVREYVYNGITQYNRNKLLWRDESVDGLKTGYTQAAGYCLVTSAARGGMRLISVVLNSASGKSRARESQALLNFGFRFFETHKLYGALEPLTTVRVWKGDVETLGMGLEKDLYVTVPRGQYRDLDASMEIDAKIMAPVGKGEPRGRVRVVLGEQEAAERPLVALRPVAAGSLWQRLKDHVMLYFE